MAKRPVVCVSLLRVALKKFRNCGVLEVWRKTMTAADGLGGNAGVAAGGRIPRGRRRKMS